MSTTLPAERLEILIPRLASNFDGEVVATARAIGRTLHSAGMDWHDLAGVIAKAPAVTGNASSEPQSPEWRDMTLGTKRLWLVAMLEMPGFTAWERNFLSTIAAHWLPRTVSEKQAATLDRLIERAWDAGVRI